MLSNWSELQIMIFNGYFPAFSFSELLDVCGFHDDIFIYSCKVEVVKINMLKV